MKKSNVMFLTKFSGTLEQFGTPRTCVRKFGWQFRPIHKYMTFRNGTKEKKIKSETENRAKTKKCSFENAQFQHP